MKIFYGGLMAVAVLALAGCSQVEEPKEPQEVIQNSNEALTVEPEAGVGATEEADAPTEQLKRNEDLDRKLGGESGENKAQPQQETSEEGKEMGEQMHQGHDKDDKKEKSHSDDVITKEAEKCIKDGGVYNSFAQKCFKD